MQYIADLIDEFGRPYCTDERVLYVLDYALKEANRYIEEHYTTYDEEKRYNKFRYLFKVVQCANRDAMEDNDALPVDNNWETDYPELWSPFIDFTQQPLELQDTNTKIYRDDLSVIVCKAFPEVLPQPYGFTPIELAVVTYDIWLQAVLTVKNPYAALRTISHEPIF